MTADINKMPEEVRQYKTELQDRVMLVRKAKVVPIEAIVRGYITGNKSISGVPYPVSVTVLSPGSAWEEYRKTGTAHNMPLPEGLQECEKLPVPLFTPSTKAEQGQHDENISQDQGKEMLSLATSLVGIELRLVLSSGQTSRPGTIRQDFVDFAAVVFYRCRVCSQARSHPS